MADQTSDILVQFFTEPVEMRAKSEEAGRPIYEDREHVRIAFTNDTRTEIVRQVEENDRFKYPEQYEAFQKQRKKAATGTPIEEWPLLSKSQVKELKALDMDTVEHIANMGELTRERLGPDARELTAQAKAFLAAAKGSSEIQHIAAENERLTDENARLKRDLSAANAEIKKLTDEATKAAKKAA